VPIVGIDHVQLAIPRGGEQEAEAFFVGLLGMTRLPKPEALAGRGGCWFAAGDIQIHVGIEDDFRPARKAHPALAVTDLDVVVARLRDAGVEVREGETIGGRVQRFLDDPFGNRIELVEVGLGQKR
jgi:catechol 2,3-dioxygenase-like lactoylglutathione lyase family enzyme